MWRPFSRNIAIKAKVPPGTRVYAVGDVHGRADLLQETFAKIDCHLDANPIANAHEIMLGDYIDRGPQSDEVIELMTSRRLDAQTICLMGNHETYLLDFLRDPASLAEWQHYGGLETLMSYGLAPSRNPTADDQKQLAALLAERLPTHHYDFLMTAITFLYTPACDREWLCPISVPKICFSSERSFFSIKEALERPWSTAILR